jgi:hypothetical protein
LASWSPRIPVATSSSFQMFNHSLSPAGNWVAPSHCRRVWTADLPPSGQLARRVYSRLIARYQACGVLLAMNLADDAYTLGRGLMYDAHRLQLLADDPARREDHAVAWHDKATVDLEGRHHTATRLGDGALAARAARVATGNRAANNAVRKSRGIRVTPPLPKEGRLLASRAGHPEDELDHVIASDPSHTTLVASLWHDRAGTGGVLAGANDPGWSRYVAARVTRHMVRAAAAMGVVCDLPTSRDLLSRRDRIVADLDAGRLPGPD